MSALAVCVRPQECVTSLGTNVLSVQYLNPEAFPNDCASKCGCQGGQVRRCGWSLGRVQVVLWK